jgi:hypothetical protein
MPPFLCPPPSFKKKARLFRLGGALLALASGLVGLGSLEASPAGATTAPSTIVLVRQTPFVTSTKGMSLEVAVSSQLPVRDLGLEVTLYNQATERGYFDETVHGNTADFSVDGQAPLIPLGTRGLLNRGDATLDFPVSAPGLAGRAQRAPRAGALLSLPCDCAGVYPLQVSLIDTKDSLPLASFITYLVLEPSSVASPLRFSLVIPVGNSVAYSAPHEPAVRPADEAELEELASTFGTHPSIGVSLVVSPQFVGALIAESGKKGGKGAQAGLALAALKRLAGMTNVEIEQDTYAPLDVSALSAARLGSELGPQLRAGERLLRAIGAVVDRHRYVATAPVGSLALHALSNEGVRQLLVPSNSVASFPPSRWEYPVWAPFIARGDDQVVADASDAGLESHLESGSDPVLRATQLLSDLALLYFVEQPPGNRGVTLLAPAGWRPSESFLNTLVAGLGTNPVVSPVTLSQFFSQVHPGSGEEPLLVRSLQSAGISRADRLERKQVIGARIRLASVSSLLPAGSYLVTRLEDMVLLGEAAGLGRTERVAFLHAPLRTLRALAKAITLPAGKTITITSLSAKVPISIYSTAHRPLRVELSLESSDLSFRHHDLTLMLRPKNNTREIALTARTVGDFPFQLTVRSPSGHFLLGRTRVLIRSTAISGVAVALTAGAGAFLVLWWGRSVLKKRRGRHARSTKPTIPREVSSAGAK